MRALTVRQSHVSICEGFSWRPSTWHAYHEWKCLTAVARSQTHASRVRLSCVRTVTDSLLHQIDARTSLARSINCTYMNFPCETCVCIDCLTKFFTSCRIAVFLPLGLNCVEIRQNVNVFCVSSLPVIINVIPAFLIVSVGLLSPWNFIVAFFYHWKTNTRVLFIFISIFSILFIFISIFSILYKVNFHIH